MTPFQRLACLATLGWSLGELARQLDVTPATISQWQTERRRPRPELDAWLAHISSLVAPHTEAIAAILAANPPPKRPT